MGKRGKLGSWVGGGGMRNRRDESEARPYMRLFMRARVKAIESNRRGKCDNEPSIESEVREQQMVPMAVVCVAHIGWAWAESEAQIWHVRADSAVKTRRCYCPRRRGEMPVWRLLVQLALQPMDKAPSSCLALGPYEHNNNHTR
jgi:hypothetical protein